MQHLKELILFTAAVALVWACRAIDLNWNVETTRIQPAVFEAYHGETLNLEATMLKAGKPLADALQGEWKIYWQTNGMDQAWWSAPASAPIGNKVRATFTGEMDPGANVVNGFIGCAGENYRAAFIIRFRHSPGTMPNTLLKPVPILDLANTTVINAPWPTDETIASTIRRVIEEDGITGGGTVEVDTTLTQSGMAADAAEVGERFLGFGQSIGSMYRSINLNGEKADAALSDAAAAKSEAETAKTRATQAGVQATLAGQTAQAVYAYMVGESTNAWFAATNYVTNAEQAAARHKFAYEDGMDLSTVPSSMALYEIRDGAKIQVWDQRDWTSWYWDFKSQALRQALASLEGAKADKAWGKYTAKGLDNPDEDCVWLDTSKVVLSAGYAWQKSVSTHGSFFTLIRTGSPASIGANTDGSYFEIKDDEGNSLFKISKTDSYMADASADDVSVNGDTLIVHYSANVAQTALMGFACVDLAAGDFVAADDPACPATLTWTGNAGNWVAHVTPKNPEGKLFFFAKVMVEGQTKIEHTAPTQFEKIVIGNTVYNVGTAVINGVTVLTLTR